MWRASGQLPLALAQSQSKTFPRSFWLLGAFLALPALFFACSTRSVATPVRTREDPVLAATTFDGFPLLWLGEAYDADGDGVAEMPLSGVDIRDNAPHVVGGQVLTPAVRYVDLSYGTCMIPPGREECKIPMTIGFEPPDFPPLSATVKTGQTIQIRGATGERFNDYSLYIHTADFNVIIHPPALGVTSDQAFARAVGVALALTGPTPRPATSPRPRTSTATRCSVRLPHPPGRSPPARPPRRASQHQGQGVRRSRSLRR
jgi:hypothetical protein